MKKKKNIFMRNQRKKLFKLKGFKQALSLVMVLLMCLVLLPQIPTEAAGETYTVYFDASSKPDDEWFTSSNYKFIAHAWKDDANSKNVDMVKSSNNIYKCEIPSDYTNIIFVKQDTNGAWKVKTPDLIIPSGYTSPCFKYSGKVSSSLNNGAYLVELGTDYWSDLGPNTRQGKPISFVDMTGNLSINNIVAVFGTDTNFSNSKEVKVNADGKFIVPNDTIDGSVYQYVKFKNGDKYITKTYEVISNVTDGTDININLENSVLYYGATENSDGTKDSYWSKENTATLDISNRTLYLDKVNFLSSEKTEIQIGDGAPVQLSQDENDKTTLSYLIPSGTTQQTKVTIIKEDGTKYHFFWNSSDLNNNNIVTTSNNIAVVSGKYSKSYTIYFDATLSKLSYAGDTDNNVSKADRAIPNSDGEVWCHVWKSNNTSTNADIKMTKVSSYKNGNNIWNDVYKVDLTPDTYDKVIFYSTGKLTGDSSAKTINLDIPTNLSSPCFYADSSDDIVYSNSLRRGYWNEVYTIRNPELEGEEKSNKDAESSIVDIDKKDFVRDTKTKYISTTFYDFYTDYELNGNDRDGYSYTNVDINSHRIYQPFNQFNQALSSYYKENQATDPIYWGNFQNYPGHEYYLIGKDLDLYGYDKSDITNWEADKKNNTEKKNKFFYEHHSMWGSNGQELTGTEGKNAVINLVNSNLDENGNLQINTNNGTQLAPYFNENFLEGNNAKNTVLGKVYKNVEFPFTKKALTSTSDPSKKGTVDYWEFNSADTSLEMKKDSSKNEYYLGERNNNVDVKGQKPEGNETEDGNFFPFNTSYQSGKATQLNYGFAMKLQFDFKLTNTGTVKTSDGNDVPIEFNFSGDDDVWIFIDGKLALDIGGGHGAVSGTLNFKDKKYTVSRIKNQNSNVGGTISPNVGDFTLDNKKSTHTLTMFYMERGLWESNMRVTFNFPDENKLQVEKQVVIPEVDSVFDNAMENLKNTNFDFSIKNLATDDIEYTGSSSTEEKTKIFNSYTSSDKDSTIGKVYDVKASITTKDSKNVVSWYAPKEKKATDGQDVTDKRLVKIYPADSSGKKSYLNVANTKDYLTFDVYNEGSNDDKGSSPFIALVDSDGTRIGAWLGDGDYSYQNSASSIGIKTWKTMKVDLSKLEKSVLDKGKVAGFNFDEVSEIQFAYWNDVTIYLGEFEFNKTSISTTSSGFTTDPSKINDYGSVKSKALSSANGAMYSLNNEEGNREVSGGTFGLTDGQTATFRDQFRKGSYIAIQEVGVDSNVFDTKWTLYEDGKEISSTSLKQTTDNVSQTQNVTSVKNIKGTEVKDGRKVLKTSKGSNVAEGVEQPENAIAFYRYDDPAGAASSVNLKAKYVNTLKTASITIKKSIKAGEEVDPNKEYKFEVSFDNVAGLGLEKNTPVAKKEFTLKPGEEKTISGIPVGTYCSIKEVKEDSDDFTLEEIKGVSVDGEVVDLTNLSLGTTINGDKSYEFVNSVYPTVGVKGEKNWEDDNSTERPETIEIQLQRRIKGSDSEFEIAKDRDGNQIENKIVKEQDAWEYSYEGLPKYVDYRDNSKGEYEYKVVEIKVGNKPVNESGYRPEYSTDSDGNLNITNKKAGSITIVKADSETEETITASNSKFKIQKLKDTSKDKEVDAIVDSDFDTTSFTESTGSTENGVIKFDNLPNGTYLITEVEAPSGYIKLDKPFKITIPYEYKAGDIVDGKVAVTGGEKADITLKVLNPKGAVLPRAGLKGISLYLAIGTILVMVSGAFVLYKLNKDKKIN